MNQGDLIWELKTNLLTAKADLERETDLRIVHYSTASGDVDSAPGCLSAIRDSDVIRTYLAQLASGNLRLPSRGDVYCFRYSTNKQEIQVYGTRSSDQASPRSEDDAIQNGVDGYPFGQVIRWLPAIPWTCAIRHIIRIHLNTPSLCAIFSISLL